MRSALICLFFAAIIRKEETRAEQHDDFRPTPIPLNTWSGENQVPAGTLQEFIKTDLPPTVAAIPAHYWEDALRHSVYLTLVRDKIDQLIEKGEIISPNSQPDGDASKGVDDHNLWEKIKAAPFDRVKEEPLPPSDSIILARGRLLEDKVGYRFAEGDLSPEKCSKNNCTHTVKAYWSVKRTRQGETSPGKYHYELTFSVTSQSTKALRKKYENPVRTFTIRENAPTERPWPQTYNHNQGTQIQHGRAQRAVWVHKNIGPSPNSQSRPGKGRGLDRLFSSLFSDEDNYDDSSYRLKSNAYIPQAYQIPKQHAKISRYSERQQPFHQKKYAYNVKPPSFRNPRPPLQPPPMSYTSHSYFDVNYDSITHLPIDPDNRPIPFNPVKTTKPAILPTPISNIEMLKDPKTDEPLKTILDVLDYTTKEPKIASTTYKVYTHKQTSMKVNYLPENIRHPIYNAPPGVFVTMDKKPFKPMPPLKSILSKPHKTAPSDFRPSPQIHDTLNTNTDSTADTAFRPMSLNLTEFLNMNKKAPKNQRKPVTSKKPPKRPDNIKPIRLTTALPDIITANSEDGNDDIRWAEILAAFTRTTPMEKEKEIMPENDYIIMTTTAPTTTEKYKEEPITTSTTTTTTNTTTTTAKPKRTRPPPKFKKPEKIKKHKRVTSTTTSTTTTPKPTWIYPQTKIFNDLTPQASSAATNAPNSVRESKPTGGSTSTSSTTTITTSTSTSASTIATTSQTLATTNNSVNATTTTTIPSTTVKGKYIVVPTQPKSKNRFRQSMLMGTSLNHDKWSVSSTEKNKTTVTPTSYNLRRKASKFQGYVPPSTPRTIEKEKNEEDHKDHAFNSNNVNFSSTTSHSSEDIQVKTPRSTEPTVKDTNTSKEHDMRDSIEMEMEQALEPKDIQGTKDSNEFIFPISPSSDDGLNVENRGQHKANQTVMSQISVQNNKTKCKNKKHQNLTTADSLKPFSDIETTTITIRTSSIDATSSTVNDDNSDLYNELLGGFTMDDVTEQLKANMSTTIAPDEPKESESVLHEEVFQIDEDIESLLNSLQQRHDKNSDDDDEYEEEDDEDSPFENDKDGRDLHEDYYDETEIQTAGSQERPFNLLELMAME